MQKGKIDVIFFLLLVFNKTLEAVFCTSFYLIYLILLTELFVFFSYSLLLIKIIYTTHYCQFRVLYSVFISHIKDHTVLV